MSALTDQLDALIAEHGLASINIGRLARSDEPGSCFWHVDVQAILPNGKREIGGSGHGHDDAGTALAEALERLNAKRAPAVVVPVLEAA